MICLSDEFKAAVAKEMKQALAGDNPKLVYRALINTVEPIMLEYLLDHTMGVQCDAAKVAGINRGTLRSKLNYYGMLQKS